MFEAHRQVYTTQKIFNPCMLRIFDIGNYCVQLFRTVCQPNMCVAQHASVLGGCDQGTFRYVSAPKAPALTRRSDTRGHPLAERLQSRTCTQHRVPHATVRNVKNDPMHPASKPKSVVTCLNGELDAVAEKCGKRLTRLKIFADTSTRSLRIHRPSKQRGGDRPLKRRPSTKDRRQEPSARKSPGYPSRARALGRCKARFH